MSLITDNQKLVKAVRFGTEIPIYDDGFGKLYIHRDSMGISGIVRAKSWEDAYSICEDVFFPEASETIDEIRRDYGRRVCYRKIVKSDSTKPFEVVEDNGFYFRFNLKPNEAVTDDLSEIHRDNFIRWQTEEVVDKDSWPDNPQFQEAYGFRPCGPNNSDKLNHGIYEKDLNGDSLEILTPELCNILDIELTIEDNE